MLTFIINACKLGLNQGVDTHLVFYMFVICSMNIFIDVVTFNVPQCLCLICYVEPRLRCRDAHRIDSHNTFGVSAVFLLFNK